jgi:hypothetical protein
MGGEEERINGEGMEAFWETDGEREDREELFWKSDADPSPSDIFLSP